MSSKTALFSLFGSSWFGLSLRALAMAAKFILILFIGKHLSIGTLGEYGLFTATITLSLYVLGLDFYAYSTREIIAASRDNRICLIKDQFVLYLLMYVIFLPLLIVVFLSHMLSWKYLVYFYIILIFEHLSQELFRIFIAINEPLFANAMLFVRSGIWVYTLLILWQMDAMQVEDLTPVWRGWAAGAFLSVLFAVMKLKNDLGGPGDWKRVDWRWVVTGVKLSIPFLIATIAYKVIEFSDRYMIEYFIDTEKVGIYTFFSGVANVVYISVFTLVTMHYYPRLIEEHQTEQFGLFERTTKLFARKTLYGSLLFSVIMAFMISPVLSYLGKAELQDSIGTLWILIVANVVLNLSSISHYVLYAAKEDKILRNSAVAGAVTNIVLNLILIRFYGIAGAAAATAASFALIWMLKHYYSLKVIRR